MNLAEFAVKKPVSTMMAYLGLFLLGLLTYTMIPQDLYPPITFPQLTVVTNYPNAAPEEVENLVTKVIEEAVSTVKGVKNIRSVSREGTSMVLVEFTWGTKLDFASLAMREKIDLVKSRLPRDANEPIVLKFNPFARPMMVLSVTGNYSPEDLLKVSEKILKDKLEKVKGVASAGLSGGRERQIFVEINQAQLKASRADILSIVQSLKDSNLNYPGGSTKEKFYEYLIRTMGEFEHVSDIGKTVITLEDAKDQRRRDQERSTGGWDQLQIKSDKDRRGFQKRIITLNDVSVIVDDFKEIESYSRYNGKNNISIAIQKQTAANTIKTAEKVRKELKKLLPMLPKGVDVDIVYDQSIFIKNSIRGLFDNAWQGGLLAFIILFLFLRSFVNSLIVIFIIPTSILATFSLMHFTGVSINMMSLAGLAMGVGMIIDSGIVLIENVSIKREEGMGQKEAAISGTSELAKLVISSILSNAAVFFPMIFVIGIAGQLFKQLSMVVVFILLVSVPIAITIVPRLYSMGNRPFVKKPEFGIILIARKLYDKALNIFLNFPITSLLAIFVLFMSSLFLMSKLDFTAMPKVDEGKFSIKVDMRTGTVLAVTNAAVEKVEKILLEAPEIKDVTVRVGSTKSTKAGASLETLGSNQGQIMLNMKEGLKISTNDFVQQIREKIDKLHLKEATINYIVQDSEIGSAFAGGADIVIDVKGPRLDTLEKFTREIKAALKKIPGLTNIKDTVPKSAPETKILVRKDKAASYGLSVKAVAETALYAVKGVVPTRLKEGGREIDIMVRMREEDRKNIDTLKKSIYIKTQQGFDAPLNDVCTLKSGMGPSEVIRLNQRRTINVLANIYGRKRVEVEQEVEKALKSIIMTKAEKENYTIDIGGDREATQKSIQSLVFALILSVLLIYMIMASQFESLWQPFIIMFSIPLSIIGVAVALYVTNTPLSGVAFFGIIILGGIVVNNGIILIENFNMLREEGETLREALVESGRKRFRPIIMTALTTLVALIPLALGLGDGGELRAPMARAIIGGVFASTPLTLLVIPTIILVTERLFTKLKKK
ncbi:MAG: efflux RND transporter permease subunit [Candidatus Ancaeobacter aquaticus]|nr:efflux RND transporter permease subunit [Candidatus Ancaeobacter aquaticus]